MTVTVTYGELVGLAILALVLLGFWAMGRHWSKVPYRRKPPRDRSRDWGWFIGIGWTLPLI